MKKYFQAMLLQHVKTEDLASVYNKQTLRLGDRAVLHVGLNKPLSEDHGKLLIGLPVALHALEFFSLKEIKAIAPQAKALGIERLDYDLEPGVGYSPTWDLQHPIDAIRYAAKAAHDKGLLFQIAPSRRILADVGPKVARYCDSIHIQAQALQAKPAEYERFVEDVVRKLRAANPKLKISAQVTTTTKYTTPGKTLLETMKTAFREVDEVVDGVAVWYQNDPEKLKVLASFMAWIKSTYSA